MWSFIKLNRSAITGAVLMAFIPLLIKAFNIVASAHFVDLVRLAEALLYVASIFVISSPLSNFFISFITRGIFPRFESHLEFLFYFVAFACLFFLILKSYTGLYFFSCILVSSGSIIFCLIKANVPPQKAILDTTFDRLVILSSPVIYSLNFGSFFIHHFNSAEGFFFWIFFLRFLVAFLSGLRVYRKAKFLGESHWRTNTISFVVISFIGAFALLRFRSGIVDFYADKAGWVLFLFTLSASILTFSSAIQNYFFPRVFGLGILPDLGIKFLVFYFAFSFFVGIFLYFDVMSILSFSLGDVYSDSIKYVGVGFFVLMGINVFGGLLAILQMPLQRIGEVHIVAISYMLAAPVLFVVDDFLGYFLFNAFSCLAVLVLGKFRFRFKSV